ncbi:MAG: NAD(P)/FAD-dependent oxidoreductase [Eubacteriales bacterium]|nr:NAD(P)/FAD-dependent oxidoreductase [Eubacteriales bacterium]
MKVIIIGAGPAGLTAAYELLRRSEGNTIIVLEESNTVGGISRTVVHNGNRMDMGGHRLFSRSRRVNEWWESMLPAQGAPSFDDRKLGRKCSISPGGPDPESEDRVMLRRNRISRIYFDRKFFDYPISLKPKTLKNMGLVTTAEAGMSYLKSCLFPRSENSLEDFYINRFGKKLYSMFFENYTENLWGRHPDSISPEWGAQRVKGLSITAVLKDSFSRLTGIRQKKVETSLIEEFSYPKLGPGQLWEITAEKITELGGSIVFGSRAAAVIKNSDNRITGVTYIKDGAYITEQCDILISSMPLKDLTAGMNDVPERIAGIAERLPYRDYITVGILMKKLHLKNETGIKTLGGIVPDNWIYVHDKSVSMGRLQIYNNWSPYLVKDPENTVWVGLEYFCSEGDAVWSRSDEKMTEIAVSEIKRLGMITDEAEVLDTHVERVKKAYPAYFDSYCHIDELRSYLDTIPNLYCIGRNGQHRYNNIDHSMSTAFEAVDNILSGTESKENIWNVNTEEEYHEGKYKKEA